MKLRAMLDILIDKVHIQNNINNGSIADTGKLIINNYLVYLA